jgi:transposase InsO family protein
MIDAVGIAGLAKRVDAISGGPAVSDARQIGELETVIGEHGVKSRLTKPNHPWTNGQVERMNRTLKEATVPYATTTKPMTSCAATSPTSFRFTILLAG